MEINKEMNIDAEVNCWIYPSVIPVWKPSMNILWTVDSKISTGDILLI